VHRQKRPAEREQQVTSVIAQLANEYPQAKTMSEPDFTHWVIAASVVSDKSVVSSLSIKEDTLDLLVSRDDLPTVATNLYKFVKINDAFAARCGCDARTNVGVGDIGFPAYLFRLDPEERTSKILIAIGGPAIGFTSRMEIPAEPFQESKKSSHDCARAGVTRRRYESIKYFARLSRELPKIADCLAAERGEFELPVPISEQTDYKKMAGFAAPGRIVGIARGSNA
jgi:hypothetical protein